MISNAMSRIRNVQGVALAMFATFLLAYTRFAYAQPRGLTSPIEGDLWSFLGKIISSVVYILFPILVLMLVYTGYLFVAAQGNPAKLQEAKKAFVWTLIGGFVVLGAQALSMAIKSTIEGIAAP